MEALLEGLEGIEKALETLDKKLEELGKKDEDCERLMTVPGVGVITALTYKVALDGPERFTTSEVVGRLYGLNATTVCLRGDGSQRQHIEDGS